MLGSIGCSRRAGAPLTEATDDEYDDGLDSQDELLGEGAASRKLPKTGTAKCFPRRKVFTLVICLLGATAVATTCFGSTGVPEELVLRIPLDNQRVLGASPYWRREAGGLLFNHRNDALEDLSNDAGFQCAVVEIPHADNISWQISAFEPYASDLGWRIVHHIDIILCDSTAKVLTTIYYLLHIFTTQHLDSILCDSTAKVYVVSSK